MKIKNIAKKLLFEVNPMAKLRREKMRRRLSNSTMTFLCPNCIGGILFHDLGLQFRSPTVNLMMLQKDFVKFVCDMEYYLSQKLCFFKHDEYSFPCAYLDDIVVHFTHYHSAEDAETKWKERSKRIDRDNLFVFLEERDDLTEKDIRSLSGLDVRGLVVFTANYYPDIPYTVYIPKYARDGEVGNILRQSIADAGREYEKYFDFVKWFNEAQGSPFDATSFAK